MGVEQLTPISEVYKKSDRIRMHIPFPAWVEVENIGVNLSRAELLMNLGGIRNVRFLGETEGERSVVMPVGIGTNPDGSRTAGMGVAKESAKHFSVDSDKNRSKSFFRNAEWVSIAIHLNLVETQRKIEEEKGNLRKAESWAPQIDNALRKGIMGSGTKHLLTNLTGRQKVIFCLSTINSGVLTSFNLSIMDTIGRLPPQAPTLGELSFNLYLNAILWAIWGSVTYRAENRSGSGYRISLFPGYEIDRAAVLQILTRTVKLVKPLPNKEDTK